MFSMITVAARVNSGRKLNRMLDISVFNFPDLNVVNICITLFDSFLQDCRSESQSFSDLKKISVMGGIPPAAFSVRIFLRNVRPLVVLSSFSLIIAFLRFFTSSK